MGQQRVDGPFVAGMVTDEDSPAYTLGLKATTFAQDLIATRGVARQRRGFDGYYTVGVAGAASGLWKGDYALANTENLFVVTHSGTEGMYVNSAALGTTDVFTIGVSDYDEESVLGDGSTTEGFDLAPLRASGTGTVADWPSGTIIPRAFYNDELLSVYTDGITPMWRYAGATEQVLGAATGTPYLDSLSASVIGTWPVGMPSRGAFISIDNGLYAPIMDTKIAGGSRYEMVLADTLTEAGTTTLGTGTWHGKVAAVGRAYPSIPVYDEGVITVSSGVATGEGVEWNTGTAGVYSKQDNDGIIVFTNTQLGTSYHGDIDNVTSGTTMTVGLPDIGTNINYEITRACPFTDVEVHKESLFGIGVDGQDSRVYVFPQGYNLQMPPGFEIPHDPGSSMASTIPFDFKADFINVPTYADGDRNVAILSFGDALGVIKERSLHVIYGAYPQFSQQKLADGAGCLDVRSAWVLPAGPFWAGREGIWTFQGGSPIDITEGRINRQWRDLVRGFDFDDGDYCLLGQVYDHIIVNISSDGTQKTFCFDIARSTWISEFSNFDSKFYYSTSDEDIGEDMYFIPTGTTTNQICRAAGVFFETDTDPTDAIQPTTGFAPQLKAHSPNNLSGDYVRDSRLRSMEVSANVRSTTGTSTYLGFSWVGGGHTDAATPTAEATSVIGTIYSDTVDRVDHHMFRQLGYGGRTHEIRCEVGTIDADTADIEIASITLDFRGNRSRS